MILILVEYILVVNMTLRREFKGWIWFELYTNILKSISIERTTDLPGYNTAKKIIALQ